MEISMYLATKHMAKYMEISMYLEMKHIATEVHGNFHVPCDETYGKVHGNFHVPYPIPALFEDVLHHPQGNERMGDI